MRNKERACGILNNLGPGFMLGLFAFMGLSVLNTPKIRIVFRETLLIAPQAAFHRSDLPALFSVVIGRGAMDLINIP